MESCHTFIGGFGSHMGEYGRVKRYLVQRCATQLSLEQLVHKEIHPMTIQ